MLIEFTNEEQQFIINLVTELYQDANKRQGLGINPEELMLKFIFSENFDSREIGILQYLMREQAEIWGSRSTTANEKKSSNNPFIPQKTLKLVKSISDKLGAHIIIDTETQSPQQSPRSEGSIWIMTDPTMEHKG